MACPVVVAAGDDVDHPVRDAGFLEQAGQHEGWRGVIGAGRHDRAAAASAGPTSTPP